VTNERATHPKAHTHPEEGTVAELYPLSLGLHLKRIFTELERQQQIYDLPVSKFWRPKDGRDLSVQFHGRPASTPLGPAAGPQDQLIQNIILSWLGGSRIVELKTVQIMDELKITRPCIYAGNVGFNVEWSQELKLEQSLTEYVAASMLIDILTHVDTLGLGGRHCETIFDLSVGYDLKGISSPAIRGFIDSMIDSTAVVERLKAEIPPELQHLRDVPFRTKLVNSITLSTFHGCPKEEIESIGRYLLGDVGVHTVIKLNPTQLDRPYMEKLFHEQMGYKNLQINPKAWDTSLSLDEAVAIVERLEPIGRERGLNIGVKFSNTLEILNRDTYFSDEVMYLSGPPLHPIAITLVEEWRKKVGNRYPITFAAGIDRENFPEVVALGLVPITVCTDLLKTRGYARSTTYLQHLDEKMEAVGATDVEEWVLLSNGFHRETLGQLHAEPELQPLLQRWQAGSPRAELTAWAQQQPALAQEAHQLFKQWLDLTSIRNTEAYAAKTRQNPRYAEPKNRQAPKKIGSALYLVDCISCGKCVPVCPNDANFTYTVEPVEVEARNFKVLGSLVLPEETFHLKVRNTEQWAVYADFCNECGNCDVYCPEDGGPFAQKPKFFGTMATFEHHQDRDGFYVERSQDKDRMWGRFRGRQYFLEVERDKGTNVFTDHVVELTLRHDKPSKPLATRVVESGRDGHIVEMKYYFWMLKCLEGVLAQDRVNYVNVRFLEGASSTAPSVSFV
jgi:putative selenate reductase